MSEFWKGRRVAVAGGAGFIGSFTVESLVERGAEVTFCERRPRFPDFYENLAGRARVLTGDLGDPDVCRELVDGQEVVLYLAASVGGINYNMAHPASLFQDNMRPFLNTIEAAKDEKVGRLLVTSSACVYPRESSIPTPESEGFLGLPEASNVGYGMSKRMEEFVGQMYQQEFGLSVAIARPFNAYGPRDNFDPERSHVIPALIRRIFRENEDPLRVWGSGNQTRSFLYVTDFARGLLEVAEKYPEADPVNLGTDEEVTIRDVVETLIKIRGEEIEVQFDTTKPEGQPRRACDTTKAKTKVGFQAGVGLEEGLRRTVDWYLQHGND